MTQHNKSELTKDELLIIFMAELGWVYGKYDDQCFHVFDKSGENTMTRETATALKAYITANYAPNSEVDRKLKEAVIRELNFIEATCRRGAYYAEGIRERIAELEEEVK